MKNIVPRILLPIIASVVAIATLSSCSTDLSDVEARIEQLENRMDSEHAAIESEQEAMNQVMEHLSSNEKAIDDLKAALDADSVAIRAEQEEVRRTLERLALDEQTISVLQKEIQDLVLRIAPESKPDEPFKLGLLDVGLIDLFFSGIESDGPATRSALLAIKHVNDAGGVWGRPVNRISPTHCKMAPSPMPTA